jgi:Fur family zinc uptake transcriptional regulator
MTAQELTRNQRIVYDVLAGADGPLTAYEILALGPVRDGGLKAPLTIYRALDSLLQKGLAHRIESLNAFVACSHRGPHTAAAGFIICESCKRTVELTAAECERLLHDEAAARGFELTRIGIELMGRCARCRGV